MLTRSHDRTVNIMNGPAHPACGIGLLLDNLKEALPDASLSPAVEAAGHRAPRAIAFGQITPGSARTQQPQNAVDYASEA